MRGKWEQPGIEPSAIAGFVNGDAEGERWQGMQSRGACDVTTTVSSREQYARPFRVLHVLDHSVPLHSGYSFRTLGILKGQRALGWETIHLTGPKQGTTENLQERVDGLIFERTPSNLGALSKVPLAKHLALINHLSKRLRQVVKVTKPDLIHAHSPALNALSALRVGRALRVPVVYEIRAFWEDAAADHGTAREWGLRYLMSRALETRAAARAAAVTTICDGLRNDLVLRGIPGDKVVVIPNAVESERFCERAEADTSLMQEYGLTAGHTLGFAGSLYAYEGVDLLIKAVCQISAAVPAVRLLVVGGGPQEKALRELSRRRGLGDVVHFTGRVPHAEMARYYSVMDVMVYPRIARRLTELVTPLKPLEAMAMRKLVVASDVGGHRELIRHGETGFLFPAGSVDALAESVVTVLKGPRSWESVLSSARHYVEMERSWARSVARYQDVYSRIVMRHQRRGRTIR